MLIALALALAFTSSLALPVDPADIVVQPEAPPGDVLDDPIDRLRLTRVAFESHDFMRARKSLYDVVAFMRAQANRTLAVDPRARDAFLRAADEVALIAEDVGEKRIKTLRALDDKLATIARALATFHLAWADGLWSSTHARLHDRRAGRDAAGPRSRKEMRAAAEQLDAAARTIDYAAAWMSAALERRVAVRVGAAERVSVRMKRGRATEREVLVAVRRLQRALAELDVAAHPPLHSSLPPGHPPLHLPLPPPLHVSSR